jgi:hypothetical protein
MEMRTLKLSIAITLLLGLAHSARATVPSEFTVQGVLRDNTGKLQTMPANVIVTLYDSQSATTGMLAGPYVVNAVPVSNGLFTVTIPEPTLATKIASALAVWIEVSAGNDTFPRQKVSTNMFALMCASADDSTKLGGVDASSYARKTDTAPDSAKLGGVAASGYLTVTGTAADASKLGGVAASGYLTTATAAATYQHVLLTPSCGVGKYIQAIATDGTVTCGTANAGTVTSVSVSAPLAINNGATTPAISLGVVPIANGGTGSATQSFVDLTTNQSIAGNKTFSGNVGIGNTAPGAPLEVGSSTVRGIVNIIGSGNSPALTLLDKAAGGGQHTFYENSGSLNLFDQVAALSRLFISASGNVGIGTTTPGAMLTVFGHVKTTSDGNSGPRSMDFWTVGANAGTTCNTACGNGYCFGAYWDDTSNNKSLCGDSSPNRDCICFGHP